jgi:hypothetical protein
MNFAKSRAEQLGFTKVIRRPNWKKCRLCKNGFIEDSLPALIIEIQGINQLDFCSPCISKILMDNKGKNNVSRESIIEYAKVLAVQLGRIPSYGYEEKKINILNLDCNERITLLKILRKKPTRKRVKEVFGSWFVALIHAGILDDGTRKTQRGIQSVAQDGHICFSLGERTIDDFLFTHSITHEREPLYPERKYRGDFKCGDIYIEYFGLSGNSGYDQKSSDKINLCKKYNISLIEIYPRDLVEEGKLEELFSILIN